MALLAGYLAAVYLLVVIAAADVLPPAPAFVDVAVRALHTEGLREGLHGRDDLWARRVLWDDLQVGHRRRLSAAALTAGLP